MRLNRRNVLIGLGTITVGGGAALGTGAFSQVEATRDVEIETEGDGAAYVTLEAADGADEYIDENGQLSVNLDKLNEDATTTIDELVVINLDSSIDGDVNVTDINVDVDSDSDSDRVLEIEEDDFDELPYTFGLEIDLEGKTDYNEDMKITVTVKAGED